MLMQTTRPQAVEPVTLQPIGQAGFGSSIVDLSQFMNILRRRRLVIFASFIFSVGLGIAHLSTTKPMYSSAATIYLDAQQSQLARGEANPLPSNYYGLDDVNINSQVEILKSEQIAIKVIKDLKLTELPEFARPQSLFVEYLGKGISQVRTMLGLGQIVEPEDDSVISAAMIDSFEQRLKVERVPETLLLSMTFESESPQRAAAIANAVANAYLDEKLNARFGSVKRASAWLEDRLAELRRQAEASDRNVQAFKSENGIIDSNGSNGPTISDSQLNDLSRQLLDLQLEASQKQARYDQVQAVLATGDPNSIVVDAFGNPLFTQLQQQYSDVSQEEAKISRQYGPNHEASLKLKRQMQDIQALILKELSRIGQTAKSDLDVANSKLAEARDRLAKQTSLNNDIAKASVKLRELERIAQSDQNLYESFLDRYNATIQQQTFPVTDARVLTFAKPPKEKSSPKTAITVALSAIGGLVLGLMLALARELADRTFRSPSQVERELAANCAGALPQLPGWRLRASRKRLAKPDLEARLLAQDLGVLQFAVKEPFSRFSETLRAVKLAGEISIPDRNIKVIGIVSALPNEGKSMISMNTAALLAEGGKSVLIIDGDIRNPSLSRELTPGSKFGLVDVLSGAVALEDTVYRDPGRDLRFLPASNTLRHSNTSELLGSEAMQRLIEVARDAYDYVIIDLPPLVPVVDSRAVAPLVDGFVLVVEWGRTTIGTVTQALHDAFVVREKIFTVLLNKADLASMRLYTRGEGKGDYYTYEKFGNYLSGN